MTKSHALWRSGVAALIVSLGCTGSKDLQNPALGGFSPEDAAIEGWVNSSPEAISFSDAGAVVKTWKQAANEAKLFQEAKKFHTDPGEIPQLTTVFEGKNTDLPLKHTAIKADLEGFIAKVEVTQIYRNDFISPIEATYIFPLPENSAVYSMDMKIGDRIIGAEIKKRAEAKEMYDQAKKDGYTAALLEQQRPNVFKQSVANLEPGKEIAVTVRYSQDLTYDAGFYEFVFPMVVGPRFFPPEKAGANGAKAEPGANEVNPPLFGDGQRPGNNVSVSVMLRDGLGAFDFAVPTHDTQFTQYSSGDVSVTLDKKDEIPNRDFVMRYRIGGKEPQGKLLAHQAGKGGYFSLVVHPPEMDLNKVVGDREIIFVVDVSGSMWGAPLELCKDAMRESLGQLRPVDTFNILTFSGATQWAFKKPVPANKANVAEAIQMIDGLRAGGGTYMLNAINEALRPTIEQGRNRYVFFMTDGYVGNEAEIIAASGEYTQQQESKGQKSKVFGFGVGASPNKYLLDGLATSGKGLTVYATNREDPVRAVNQFYRYIDHPVWEDISVDWAGLPVEEIQPDFLPDLFASRPVIIHGKYNGSGDGNITIKGKANGKEVSMKLAVSLPKEETKHRMLATLWGRAKISSLSRDLIHSKDQSAIEKITNIGLEYHLVTAYTSLIAIDKSKKVSNGDTPTINQPAAAPEGTSANNFGPSTPTVAPRMMMPTAVMPSPDVATEMDSTIMPYKSAPKSKTRDNLDELVEGKKDPKVSKEPATLTKAQIEAVIKKANTSSCKSVGTGKVNLKININSAGSVTSVTADGSALGNCLAGILKRLKFPAISSPSQSFTHSLSIE
jgi:Ca-activated chloride channel family protein